MVDPDQIMLRMGFAPSERGPYVTELRALIARKVAQGMQNHSAGTWDDASLTAEERARELLALWWSVDHGHSCTIKVIDHPIAVLYNLKTGRRYLRVRWRGLLPWIGDRWRSTFLRARLFRDRTRGIKNPYTP